MVAFPVFIDEVRNPALSDEEFAAALDGIRQQRLEDLWRSATNWQERYISNAAYGLLAIGIIMQKPKCMACMAWVNNIWTNHYYVEKPKVTHEYQGYDFSVCGPMPFTVPELTAEVMGG